MQFLSRVAFLSLLFPQLIKFSHHLISHTICFSHCLCFYLTSLFSITMGLTLALQTLIFHSILLLPRILHYGKLKPSNNCCSESSQNGFLVLNSHHLHLKRVFPSILHSPHMTTDHFNLSTSKNPFSWKYCSTHPFICIFSIK